MFIMTQNENTGHIKGTWKQGRDEAKHSLYNYKGVFTCLSLYLKPKDNHTFFFFFFLLYRLL